MEQPVVASGIVALLFAAVHLSGKYLRFLQATPRSVWLSFAGGVGLAYVFVHLLPELAAWHSGAEAAASEEHVYLVALGGLLLFYGIERLVRSARRGGPDREESGAGLFWTHVGAYAVYNALIGYLLLRGEEQGLQDLVLYAVALGFHFLVNDQGLREHHGREYDSEARWLLAAAPLAGWAAGLFLDLGDLTIATIFAFLAGGIVLNVLKEELPEDRDSRFWALALGAGAFSALLLAAR